MGRRGQRLLHCSRALWKLLDFLFISALSSSAENFNEILILISSSPSSKNIYKDTLLNVFLAIAVDNLATAQELTAEQEAAEALAKEEKERNVAKEVNIFLPAATPAAGGTEPAKADGAKGGGKGKTGT